MKPTMYVEKRSDLTLLKKAFELTDATCHRTRLKCGCKAYKGADNNRDGLLIVKYDAVVLEIIRCKGYHPPGSFTPTKLPDDRGRTALL